MRIGLSLIDFNPGRMGGVESYFWNLLESLQQIDRENEYVLLCDERSFGYFKLHQPNFSQVLIRSRRPFYYRWTRSLVWRRFGVDIMKYSIGKLNLDVVHHPFSMMSPKQSLCPVVLTVHDVQHEFYPEFFGPKMYGKRRAGSLGSLAVAKAVIADSEFSKKSLIAHYGVAPEKITVVYLGMDLRFKRVDDPARLAEVRGKYRLERPFIYFPAASWPHKNHAGLLRALKILVENYQFDGELVLTGIAEKAQSDVERLAEELGLKDRIRMLGYLESSELPVLFSLARMLAFPSLFEGFGLPVLEAMASGCPVACSNTTSLPEVAGNAALLFDPSKPEEIAAAVWRVWSDAELRAQLLEKAERQGASFKWEDSARATLAIYRQALGQQ